ncbi:hypothetical protein Taro_044949 [Colocasia esculenta]|uniref:Uncharacterized protein n=1 Tax=Colocasia esculenta TaxID=4460 RepID=A0A843WVA7_COLES|nr:hypothetical protein [Colocasia esculenta]
MELEVLWKRMVVRKWLEWQAMKTLGLQKLQLTQLQWPAHPWRLLARMAHLLELMALKAQPLQPMALMAQLLGLMALMAQLLGLMALMAQPLQPMDLMAQEQPLNGAEEKREEDLVEKEGGMKALKKFRRKRREASKDSRESMSKRLGHRQSNQTKEGKRLVTVS